MALEETLRDLTNKIGEIPSSFDIKTNALSEQIKSLHTCVDDKFTEVNKRVDGIKLEVKTHKDWHDKLKTVALTITFKVIGYAAVAMLVIALFSIDKTGTVSKMLFSIWG